MLPITLFLSFNFVQHIFYQKCVYCISKSSLKQGGRFADFDLSSLQHSLRDTSRIKACLAENHTSRIFLGTRVFQLSLMNYVLRNRGKRSVRKQTGKFNDISQSVAMFCCIVITRAFSSRIVGRNEKCEFLQMKD